MKIFAIQIRSMKALLLVTSVLFISLLSQAQAVNPVSWTFSAKKTGDKTYEIHMTAKIISGWHIYSQNQPDDAIAYPTAITINNNPLLKLNGSVKEIGKLEKYKDQTVGATNHQYSSKVDFVQVVKIKSSAKTNITGNVEFQTCDDKKCLPPKTVPFNVALN
jgi:thiol:disulfide interchange protein DsbD